MRRGSTVLDIATLSAVDFGAAMEGNEVGGTYARASRSPPPTKT